MSKTIENLKSGNYEVVDNQGVSVTIHFVECLEKEIADLEAKLAEKQKLLEDSIDVHETEEKDIYKLRYELAGADETIQQLKQQLAEKEEKIETQKKNLAFFYDVFNNPKGTQTLETINQDKISFCIEQLQHTKNRIDNLRYNEKKCLNKKDCIEDCLEEIDNQIEELKKGSEQNDK